MMFFSSYAAAVVLLLLTSCDCLFVPSKSRKFHSNALFTKKQITQDSYAATEEEQEKGAGVVGAEFFGGNKQKEELFDAVAEEDSAISISEQVYNRFEDEAAFPDALAKSVAQSLQQQMNTVLYDEEPSNEEKYKYAPNVKWETPLTKDKESQTPLKELELALDFYRSIDAAIVAASKLRQNENTCTVSIQWELSLKWPNFWEARVVLTGFSTLEIENNLIVRQVDVLDQENVLDAISPQILPRFWDMYHIGMTPAAETVVRQQPRSQKKGLLSKYKLFEVPSRLVLRPSMLDIGTREDAYAQVIPNHAFTAIIKTMGSNREQYITTSPAEIQISRGSGGKPLLEWTIPLAVRLMSSFQLPLPDEDEETPQEAQAKCKYEFQPRRLIATVPYGGFPQDAEVANVRKKLYESVTKDGLKPMLDESGRPTFVFFMNNAKACYTENGLGMSVYDWRPLFLKTNEVGIELEL